MSTEEQYIIHGTSSNKKTPEKDCHDIEADLLNSNLDDKSGVKLFLGGIPVEMDDEQVANALSQVLEIVSFNSESYEGKRNRGYGYLTVKSIEDAKNLLNFKPFYLDGRKIDIKLAESREESMAKMSEVMKRKLFVSQLNKDTDEAKFKGYFQQFGEIEYAYIVLNLRTKKSRSFGFVLYQNESSAEAALKIKDH